MFLRNHIRKSNKKKVNLEIILWIRCLKKRTKPYINTQTSTSNIFQCVRWNTSLKWSLILCKNEKVEHHISERKTYKPESLRFWIKVLCKSPWCLSTVITRSLWTASVGPMTEAPLPLAYTVLCSVFSTYLVVDFKIFINLLITIISGKKIFTK